MDILKSLNELIQQANNNTLQTLNEFAYPISLIKQRFIDLSENIIEHKVKIILYKKEYPNTINHGCSEILANLTKCMKKQIKRKRNPYPTQQEIYHWLLLGYDSPSTLKGIRYSLQQQYENPLPLTHEDLYKQVLDCLKYMSPLLAQMKLNKQMLLDYFNQVTI